MSFPCKTYRDDTPACTHQVYFNNAKASLMPLPVIEAMNQHLALEAKMGSVMAAKEVQEKLDRPYHAIAELINASSEEIALFDTATRAWDMAFYSHQFQTGDRIVTSLAEYSSNYLGMLQMCQRTGVQIDVIENDADGQISLEALEKALDERVKLIALTHIPTSSGLVNPAIEVGKIARKWNIPYLLDACQSVGQMPINVQEIQCDMLSAPGRKYLRGPRGTGFLYVRQSYVERLDPHYIDITGVSWESLTEYHLLPTAKRFEKFEHSPITRLGLGVAVDYAMQVGMETAKNRIRFLADTLREQLAGLSRVKVLDPGKHRGGLVTFSIDGLEPADVQAQLERQQIIVSINSLQYARLDLTARQVDAYVRASLHYFNTEEEIGRFMEAIQGICGQTELGIL